MSCDVFVADSAQAFNLGGFVDTFDLTLLSGAIVGDVVVCVQTHDLLDGFGGINFPSDDAGNDGSAGLLGENAVVCPATGAVGFRTSISIYPVVTAIAPGQQVHLSYTSAPAISFNYAYVLRGVAFDGAPPSIKYHGDFGTDCGHGVGACAEELFAVPSAGMIFETTTIMHPYASYAGDTMAWFDGGVIGLDAWDSDPDDLEDFGFDSAKGEIGLTTVPSAGSYGIGGCWSVEQDTYRGGFAFFLPCTTSVPTPVVRSTPGAPGVFVACGVEIANNARTVAYLQAGLGSGEATYELGDGCDCSVLNRLSGETVDFSSPASDPAPWYDADDADSTSFLGILLDPADLQGLDSTVSRSVYERSGGIQGAATGPQKLLGRRLKLRMTLVADDCCGLSYGMRWLSQQLAASNCDGCATCNAQIRVCCPPDDGSNDDEGLWIAYDVALVDGPHPDYSAGIEPDCCDMRQVTIELEVGNPYFYKQATACIDPTAIPGLDVGSGCIPFDEWFCEGAPSDPICCTVSPPKIGTVGAIVTISAPSGADAIEVASFTTCPPGAGDWDDNSGTWRTKLTVSNLESGSSLIIDSARHQILYVAPDGSIVDGTSKLLLPPDRAFRWIEIADCDSAHCVCIRGSRLCGYASGDVTISVETQLRVLALQAV